MKNRNYVAKYDVIINKAKVYIDRKKSSKKGYVKHKNKIYNF